jgi:hypothetical protein
MDVSISIDDGGLADALRAAASDAPHKTEPAVHESAQDLVTVMRADASRSRWFRFAPSITETHHGLESEVGPEKGGAGSLANIAYFGGAHGGGGTVRDPQLAANEVGPKFEDAISDVVDGLLK